MTTTPGLIGGVVAIIAILGATVAVCLGNIDAGTFAGIVGAGLGGGIGAGAHAAGVNQAKL